MQGRLFQLWRCVKDQTEQIEKIGPPLHILFLFLYFFFVIFLPWAILLNFFVFFYGYKFWDSRYRKKKEKEESSHRPATRIFVRKYRHNSVY